MHVFDIIDDVISALNQIPNHRLSGHYRDSYQLAAALSRANRTQLIRLQVRGGELLEPVQANCLNGLQVELRDLDNGEEGFAPLALEAFEGEE